MHEKLLRLLEHFDVALCQENRSLITETRYLIPQLFDRKPPLTADRYFLQKPTPGLALYYRVFTFQFMPLAFVHKLLAQCVQMKALTVVAMWKTGLIATCADEVSKLEFFPSDYKVVLSVLGHRTASLLVQLVSCVESLIQTWFPKSVYEVTIPVFAEDSLESAPASRRPPTLLMRTTSSVDVKSHQYVTLQHLARLISCGGTAYPLPSPPGAFVTIESLAPDLLLNDLSAIHIKAADLGARETWRLLGTGAFGAVRALSLEQIYLQLTLSF